MGNPRGSAMAIIMNSILGKVLYLILYVVVLPLLLILWSVKTTSIISLPAIENQMLGIFLIIGGLLIMTAGIIGLLVFGKGLPMSPFPPPNFVSQGIYKFVPHPVYAGACMLTIGISIYAKSASGLWLISPVLIMSCVAFVMGYEKEKLRKRFPEISFRTLISIPESSEELPTIWDKISIYILVFFPWFILYRIVLFWGIPDQFIVSSMQFEEHIPLVDFTVIFLMITYPLVILAPLFAKSKKDLRNFMVSSLMAAAIGFFIIIIFPFVTPSMLPITSNIWGKLLAFETTGDFSIAALPSFHVIWTFLAVSVYNNRFPSLKFLWQFIAIVISISCITTGLYSSIDVLSGLVVYAFVARRAIVWQFIQRFSERIAGSWKEWNYGHVRIIYHGLFGGLATFTGISLAGSLIGKDHLPAIFLIAVTAMISAALWAQFIEGSKKLLRPLGFYGGVVGIFLGCLLAHLIFGSDFFLLCGSFAVAAPWIQGIGRLRCLVQGCCLGRITSAHIGIRYFHHRSRVVELSNLKGEYLHATPVYSILANIVYGMLLIKFWFLNLSPPFIIGLSFILNGFSRFVEESYRGEPQTPIVMQLRLYQWIAMIGIILGVALTTIPYSIIRPGIQFSIETLVIAIVAGLLSTFLTGVDFPLSNKRFSRLV